MQPGLGTRCRRGLLALGGAALALGVARAGDPPGSETVAQAREAFARAHGAYLEWGKDEPQDSALRRDAREQPANAQDVVAFPDRVPAGMAADAAAQEALLSADTWIGERLEAIQARAHAVSTGEEDAPITTASTSPGPAPERVDAVLDVRALVRTPADFPAPSCGLRRYDPSGGLDSLVEMRGRPRTIDQERLAGTLGEVVKEDEGSFVEQLDGTLVVHASPQGVARAKALLAVLRESVSTRIGLDVRSYRMTRELFLELSASPSGFALSPEAEKLLEKEAKEGKRASLLAGQTTVAQDGQIVHVFQGESRAYLSGFEVNQSGLTPVVDPSFSKLTTGFVAELRPSLDPSRKNVQVDVALVLSEPVTPCEKQKVQGVELELPELRLARTSTTVVLPLGASALVSGTFAPSREAKDELDLPLASVVFLKPTLCSSTEAAPPASDGYGTPVPRATPPEKPPQAPADLPESARAELKRLSALTKKLEADRAKVRAARIYRFLVLDVRDLIDGRHDRAAPALGLPGVGIRRAGYRPLSVRNPIVVRPGQGGFAAPPPTDAPEEPDHGEGAITEDKLELLVRSMTGGDDAWRDPASYGYQSGTLLVRQTPGMLARLADVLAALRKNQSRHVRLEAGLYRLDPALLSEIDLDRAAAGTSGGSIPASALARIDEAEKKGGERAVWLGGGFLVARSGERVYLHQGRERAYLSGFETSSGGSGAVVEKVVDPAVAILRTGITFDARATWDDEAWPRLTVEASVARARLRELGRDETQNGAVSTPSLDMDAATGSGALSEWAGLLLLGTRADEKKGQKALAVVVRARVF
ncbi:hypothetical protein HY251_02100 [bacterium]|nr:hypothetical protein [bacterium]